MPAREHLRSDWLTKRIYVSGWLVWMENNKCTPNIKNYILEYFQKIWSWNFQSIPEHSALEADYLTFF